MKDSTRTRERQVSGDLVLIREAIDEAFAEAKVARQAMCKTPLRALHAQPNALLGDYLRNYTTSLVNRKIDIFDDALLLLENGRVPSACIVSRGMIETFALGNALGNKLFKIVNKSEGSSSAEKCIDVVLKFTNSSRHKVEEQKKLKEGVFDKNDYYFSDQAIQRMEGLAATSEHIHNSLRELYQQELEQTSRRESDFQLTYDVLSEWVHPSQTSLFHNYTPEAHLIPTSLGLVHLHEAAQLNCMRALILITESGRQRDWLFDIAEVIDGRNQNDEARVEVLGPQDGE